MLGNLYIISNSENELKYVGKTYKDINIRFKEHIRSSKRFPNRPLYKAINYIGYEKFKIDLVNQYEPGLLEIREQELIATLDSYKNGYNATFGGEGSLRDKPSEKTILELFNKTGKVVETAKLLETDRKRVSIILRNNNINTKTSERKIRLNELNLDFKSVTDCANYLIEHNYTKNKYVRNKIYDMLNGRRRVCLGFTYSYL